MTDRDPTHTTLTHGELFSGVGGFSLGATSAGIRTIFSCENDPHCKTVLRHHFPRTPLFPDVSEMVGLDLVRPDILSAGSPCQGLSVAGRQRGLEDERSGLFIRFHDLVEQLDPRWAVWENVPGALTSSAGRDFGAVLGWLLGSEEPLPALPKHPKGRRSRYAGVAIGPSGSLAWRVLDARYLGVPQRRERIILVVDRNGMQAGRVMFGDDFDITERMAVDPDLEVNSTHVWCLDHLEQYAKVADTGASTPASRPDLVDILEPEVDEGWYLSAKAAGGIVKRGNRRPRGLPTILEVALRVVAGMEVSDVMAMEFLYELSLRGEVEGPVPHIDPLGTICTTMHGRYYSNYQETTQRSVVAVIPPGTYRKSRLAQSTSHPETWVEDDVTNTLNTYDIGEVRATSLTVELPELRVRRLTPLEAERLQGFPDNHTLIDGMKDTARYKMVGNAIAVPMAAHVMSRIAAVHEGR